MSARLSLVLAVVVAGSLVAPRSAAGQCQDVRVDDDSPVAYKARDGRCEGLYTGLQSAPLNLTVVSLVKGELVDSIAVSSDVLEVMVPSEHFLAELQGAELNPDITIRGRARDANLNWALDSDPGTRDNRELAWPLSEVVNRASLRLDQLGVFGVTRREGGLGGPVYVPVEVRPTRGGEGSVEMSEGGIEFVFMLPGAGKARVCTREASACEPAEELTTADGYGDGYFRATFSLSDVGLAPIAVRWRPRGGVGWEVDMLDILVW